MSKLNEKMTNYRWVICSMLFFATTVNYLDRQVLSLLQPILEEEFHWTDNDYGSITAVFSLFYAVSMLFAGRFVDRVGTKKGYAWSIAVWSLGAALHAVCGVVTEPVGRSRKRRGVAPGAGGRSRRADLDGQRDGLRRLPLRTGARRSGQLPGGDQGDGPNISRKRTGLSRPGSLIPGRTSEPSWPR